MAMKKRAKKEKLKIKELETDVLIIGGGTAGCYAAITIGKNSDLSVIVAEKANIKRSGCLAAGINAINAYNVKGVCHKIMWIMQQKMRMELYGMTC